MNENPDRHFYLYAKRHYKVEGFILDLIKILSYKTSVPTDKLSAKDVYITVMDLVHSHIGNKHSFKLFMKVLHENMYDDKLNFISSSINAAMVLLELAKVSDIPIILGKADSEVLPLGGGHTMNGDRSPCCNGLTVKDATGDVICTICGTIIDNYPEDKEETHDDEHRRDHDRE